jgi:hypothetical protein
MLEDITWKKVRYRFYLICAKRGCAKCVKWMLTSRRENIEHKKPSISQNKLDKLIEYTHRFEKYKDSIFGDIKPKTSSVVRKVPTFKMLLAKKEDKKKLKLESLNERVIQNILYLENVKNE